MIPVIGLCGKARAGKNHVGYLLRDKLQFVPWAFANPLKFTVYATGDDKWSLYDLFYGEKSPELRNELQQRGTELGRDVYGFDYWVKQAEGFLYLAENELPINGVVFTDVRFPNEAALIKKYNGCLLKIVREENCLEGELNNHRSETEVDAIVPDGIIDNTGFPSERTLWEMLLPYIMKLGA